MRFGLRRDSISVAGCSEHLAGHKNSAEKALSFYILVFHFKIVFFEDEDRHLNEENVSPSNQGLEIFEARPWLIHPDHPWLGVMYKP